MLFEDVQLMFIIKITEKGFSIENINKKVVSSILKLIEELNCPYICLT